MPSKQLDIKEDDIRPKSLDKKQNEAYLRDVARLMSQSNRFVAVACPACGTFESSKALTKHGMNFDRCSNCETVYANPRPTEQQLIEYYKTSENYEFFAKKIYPASAETRREKLFKPRANLVAELCTKFGISTGTLLEVGAGFGLFCEEMANLKVFKRIIGIELSPDLAQVCREKELETIEKPFEQISKEELFGTTDELLSTIVNFEVITHLFSPKAFVDCCASWLKKGGLFVTSCPNAKGFDLATLGALSGTVNTQHLNLMNPNSLSILLENSGFKVVSVETPGKLDAELVRNFALNGEFDLSAQPFLRTILLEEWESRGPAFQQFLVDQKLSSHMLIAAIKN
jgi:2-polyprenyl-3-methyl-5-hydroxy-6-metoxy-1,4-benzoquinol methylase